MAFVVGNKVVGRDNRASGSVAGRENMTEGVAYPVRFREAAYLATAKSTTITRSSNVATASCTGHGLAVGNIVRIAGAAQLQYNGEHRVDSTADPNTFTYAVYGDPATTATGTITATKVHQETIGD